MDGITPEKAKQILKDGKINGVPLTPKQRAFFGMVAGGGVPSKSGKSKSEAMVDMAKRMK